MGRIRPIISIFLKAAMKGINFSQRMNFTMKRYDIRKLKGKEPNALIEFMKTEKHYFKDIQDDLKKIRDPRHQSYITYGIEEIIHPLIMKNVCNLQSMQAMTNQFNDEVIIKNFGIMTGKEEKKRSLIMSLLMIV